MRAALLLRESGAEEEVSGDPSFWPRSPAAKKGTRSPLLSVPALHKPCDLLEIIVCCMKLKRRYNLLAGLFMRTCGKVIQVCVLGTFFNLLK